MGRSLMEKLRVGAEVVGLMSVRRAAVPVHWLLLVQLTGFGRMSEVELGRTVLGVWTKGMSKRWVARSEELASAVSSPGRAMVPVDAMAGAARVLVSEA